MTEGVSRGEELMRRYLDIMLPFPHIDNCRPDWLRNPETGFNLEIDRYYPTLKVGFEFQGDQHYRDTDLDQGQTLYRDKLKVKLCHKCDVLLIKVGAIDLMTSRLSNAVKRAYNHYNKHNPEHIIVYLGKGNRTYKTPAAQRLLKELNQEAIAYRAYLKARFPGTITARMKISRPKARKQAWTDTKA